MVRERLEVVRDDTYGAARRSALFAVVLSVFAETPNLFQRPHRERNKYRFAVPPGMDLLAKQRGPCVVLDSGDVLGDVGLRGPDAPDVDGDALARLAPLVVPEPLESRVRLSSALRRFQGALTVFLIPSTCHGEEDGSAVRWRVSE
jgi:hypothetical protein